VIVTCGHIFRDMDDSTKVSVDLFGPNGPQTRVGQVFDFDLEADVGLIVIPTEEAVPSTPVAGTSLVLTKGDQVACIGCSGGENPTREQLSITAINKYDGPDNIECNGTPVQGRSGGGLFNRNNELIGVCIAADEQANCGLYAHVFAIHKLLDRAKLSHLYQPQESTPPAEVVAQTETPPASEPAVEEPRSQMAEPEVMPSTSSPEEALAGAISDVTAGDAEVVIIIRQRDPGAAGQSRVVVINKASPKFLSYLNGELGETPAIAAQGMTPTTQTVMPGRRPTPPRRNPRATEARNTTAQRDTTAVWAQ
jgi:hypothetical protein